jgi:hypothetical protein
MMALALSTPEEYGCAQDKRAAAVQQHQRRPLNRRNSSMSQTDPMVGGEA